MAEEKTIERVQYLTFRLGDEEYAIGVESVQEVLELSTITKVPNTPDYMRGVINVRGSVVPVVDLRLRFGMAKTEKTVDTCIVVIELTIENEKIVVGALADSVQEVIEMDGNQIEPPPQIGTRLKTEFIRGIGKNDDNFILILEIEKIFSTEELNLLGETEKEVAN